MTTLFNPVAGNESFSTVNSIVSGSIADGINTSVVQANNSSVGAQLLLELGPQVLPPNVSVDRLHKLEGFMPADADGATLGTVNSVPFLVRPNLTQPSAITSNLLCKLPENARVVKVLLDNGGTNITATDPANSLLTIGSAATITPGTIVTTFLNTALAAQVNNQIAVQSGVPTAFAGAGASENPGLLPATNIVVVSASGDTFTTFQGLHVIVYYISPES